MRAGRPGYTAAAMTLHATPQPAILAPTPRTGRFLTFGLAPGADPRPALARLAAARHAPGCVIGLGAALAGAVPGLRAFRALDAAVRVPSTQGALFAFFGGDDAGATLHAARRLAALLGDALPLHEETLAFEHAGGRDLTGYQDGTENPVGHAAVTAALTDGAGPGLDGGSFVAVQRWVHDLTGFERLAPAERDHVIGRDARTNEELADAPDAAHVKRAAQETFDPPAFMVRRSMPWGTVAESGLVFVAYGATLDPFERVLARMVGQEDGVPDALFRFTRPVTGGYYWCPPIGATGDATLDLRALGL